MIQLDFTEFTLRSGYDPDRINSLWDRLMPNGWLAGGALRRTISGVKAESDFDFFFKSEDHKDSFCEAIIENYGFKQTKKTQHHSQFEHTGEQGVNTVVQAIHFIYPQTVEELLEAFDYTICQFAFDGSTLYTTPEALWDLARKRLVINKVTYPVSTLRRMIKYSSQGYYACGGCMKDLLQKSLTNPDAMSQLDISYVD